MALCSSETATENDYLGVPAATEWQERDAAFQYPRGTDGKNVRNL
jgi:hypothetical protein